jgi:hypothetical protein
MPTEPSPFHHQITDIIAPDPESYAGIVHSYLVLCIWNTELSSEQTFTSLIKCAAFQERASSQTATSLPSRLIGSVLDSDTKAVIVNVWLCGFVKHLYIGRSSGSRENTGDATIAKVLGPSDRGSRGQDGRPRNDPSAFSDGNRCGFQQRIRGRRVGAQGTIQQ